MVLESPRLMLRELTEADFAALYAVLSDPENMQYYPYVFDEARVRAWIQSNIDRYREFGFGLWAVCLKETDELIGDCGLTMQQINGQILPEIGYHIRKDQQRNGYATEAAKAVRDWAFSHTPFQVLYSYMPQQNLPSRKTAMAYGGRLVDTYIDADNEQTAVYAVRKEEWERRK